jgi:hypothetical protein
MHLLITVYIFLLTSFGTSQVSQYAVYKCENTIILPVILYGCGTWSLTLREEHRLRMFEDRVLRRISGAKKGD